MRLINRNIEQKPAVINNGGLMVDSSTNFILSSCHKAPIIWEKIFIKDDSITRLIGYVTVCSGKDGGAMCFQPQNFKQNSNRQYTVNDLKYKDKFDDFVWKNIRQHGHSYGDFGIGFYCELKDGRIYPSGISLKGQRDWGQKTELIDENVQF